MFGRYGKMSLIMIVLIMCFLSIIQPATARDMQPGVSGQATQGLTLPAQKLSLAWPFFNNTLRDWRLQSAKNFGVSGVDRIVKAHGVAKNEVQNSKLSQDDKSRLIAGIDMNITWYGEKKAEIANARDIASVKAIGKEVNDRWNLEKVEIKKEIGDISCDQYNVYIVEARNASSIAADKIQAIKARGKDTAAMDKKLASYNSHVDRAEGYLTKAKTEFDKINGLVGVDLHFSAGLRQLNLANGELQNAYTDLKGLYNLIYRNGATIAP